MKEEPTQAITPATKIKKRLRQTLAWFAVTGLFVALSSALSCGFTELDVTGFPCKIDQNCGGKGLYCDRSACDGQTNCVGRCRSHGSVHKETPTEPKKEPVLEADRGEGVDSSEIAPEPEQPGERLPEPEKPTERQPEVLPCQEGQVRACKPENPPGVCKSHLQRCSGGNWTQCKEAAQPWQELDTCDKIDNNCDGRIDEEVCDGKDNNCDGKIDEGCDFIRFLCPKGCSAAGGVRDQKGDLYISGWARTFSKDGVTFTPKGSTDPFVMKLDENGKLLWTRAFEVDSKYLRSSTGLVHDGKQLYIHGTFDGELASSGKTFKTANEQSDAFFAKLDPANGTIKWLNAIQGNEAQMIRQLVVDPQERLYILGKGGGKISFTPTQSITASSGADAYLASYNPDGTFRWVHRIGGDKEELFTYQGGLAINPQGDLLVGTYHQSPSVDFGIKTITSPFQGTPQLKERWCAISRWRADGTLVWANMTELKQPGSLCALTSMIQPPGSKFFYIGGIFKGEFSLFGRRLLSTEKTNLFVAKLEEGPGNTLVVHWVATAKGGEYVNPDALKPGPDGALYVSGEFKGTTTFHPGLKLSSIEGNLDKGCFVAKISPSGQWLWADRFLGQNYLSLHSLWLDDHQRLVMLSYISEDGMFGLNQKKSFLDLSPNKEATSLILWKIPLPSRYTLP